jgi:hypothetical protein
MLLNGSHLVLPVPTSSTMCTRSHGLGVHRMVTGIQAGLLPTRRKPVPAMSIAPTVQLQLPVSMLLWKAMMWLDMLLLSANW